jgi:hypothetical protein
VQIKLTPKHYVTDQTFPPKIIMKAAGAGAHIVIQYNVVNLIKDANKQALK